MTGLADVRRWDAAGLDAAAEDLREDVDRLTRIEDEIDDAVPPAWAGPASVVARLVQQQLVERLTEAVANASGARSAVVDAADRVEATQRELRAIEADATAAGLRVTVDGQVVDASPIAPAPPGSTPEAQQRVTDAVAARAAAKARIEQRLADLLTSAQMLDAELSETLEAAARGDILRNSPAVTAGDTAAAARGGADAGHLDWTGAVPRDPDELERLYRSGTISQEQYREELQGYWQLRAYQQAGIDPSTWDPAAGADALRPTIEGVYRYYGDLALAHPELQWAGMANMIGPSFAAGFFDLEGLRRFGDALSRSPVGPPALGGSAQALGSLSEEELRYYETTLLDMQKQIFDDQAPMHEAYLAGGMPAIRQLVDAGVIDAQTGAAWQQIDTGTATGDTDLVAEGNKTFLQREQFDIIADDYDRMRHHSPSGPAFTYGLTTVGEPSIPGAHGYADVNPLTASVETPGPDRLGYPDRLGPIDLPGPGVDVDNPAQGTATLETPLPDGDISQRDTRWQLIEQDTFPAYQELLRDHPDQARALLAEPVGDRIADYRLSARLDDILGRLATDWHPGFDQ